MINRFKNNRDLRKKRIRSKIKGTAEKPRLSVFRSNRCFYAQLIDDMKGSTLCAVSYGSDKQNGNKTLSAKNLGLSLAKKASEKKIKTVVFDRSGYKYHGRVKTFAEAARKGGLEF